MRAARLLVVLALVLVGLATPATAAVPFPRIDASKFVYVQGQTFAVYKANIDSLERNAQLRPKGLNDVLASANRKGRPLCHGTHLKAGLGPKGFCWQDGEDDDKNAWIPQGLTGSGDAQAGGTVGGKRIVAASWHTPGDTFTRVSFLDEKTLAYRHVLLVEPHLSGDFKAISSHGDGLSWYGDYLYLMQGSVLRVFDLRHFWAMDTAPEHVGRNGDGRFSARYHAWALPQVGAYWYQGGGCGKVTGEKPCSASLSLDRGTSSFVTVEHVAKGGNGRLVRWPIDPATGLLRAEANGSVRAVEAFASPVWAMQGAVSHNGYVVVSGACVQHAGKPVDLPSCLHGGVPGQTVSQLTEAPVNNQNLSYWPATGELWLMNEQLRERVVAHIPWRTLTGK
ncbi:hypothetical protein [Allokutzneria oryzae]|uniref:Secreted protein n=1 Tax=Allokutzneria oryzae TaxID=1378989 RepID=A0ABV5ZPC1_9PSEU